MCQHVVILAERAGYRYVSQCEHGTVHLVWDGVGFHLPQNAFLGLAEKILNTLKEIQAREDPVLCGQCRLQVGKLVVSLPLDEFHSLAAMVEEALPRVGLLSGDEMQRLHQRLGCSPRGLWLFVTDRCVGTLSWLMQERDETASLCQIEAEVDALIRAPGSSLANKRVGLFELTYQNHSRVYLDRATCCYWYRTEGGDYCNTCPHRTEEDRNARLLKYMAEHMAQ